MLPRALAVLIALSGLAAAQPDAREIVEKAFAADERNDEIARMYTFRERQEQHQFGSDGQVKSVESKTWDVTLLDGGEFRRLVARNDEPLSAKEEAKELEKLHETPKQRAKRLRQVEKDRAQARRFRREITQAFDFRLVGEETVAGVPTWVIDAEPRAGYKPSYRRAKVLSKVRGRLWIAQRDYGWVKTDVETIDRISFGWILLRLNKGTRIDFTQRWVNDEVWLMDQWQIRFQGRLGLLKGFNGELTATFSNFHKFSADSRVVATDPQP